jgi:hypothetical protein
MTKEKQVEMTKEKQVGMTKWKKATCHWQVLLIANAVGLQKGHIITQAWLDPREGFMVHPVFRCSKSKNPGILSLFGVRPIIFKKG